METYTKVLTCVIYVATWFLLLVPVKMGRPVAALAGAGLATAVQYYSQGFEDVVNGVDLSTLALLLGQLIIAWFVAQAGLAEATTQFILKGKLPTHQIVRFCIIVAVLSPLMMNDTVCLILTRCCVSVTLCNRHTREKNGRKDDQAFVRILALTIASCSNVGSAITATGNPQNALVLNLAKASGLTAGTFIAGSILPSVAALIANVGFLVLFYSKNLTQCEASIRREPEEVTVQVDAETANGEEGMLVLDGSEELDVAKVENSQATSARRREHELWFRVLVLGSLILLLVLVTALKTDPGWAALGCGTLLIVCSWSDGEYVLTQSEIDFPLLVLFSGQFVLVQRLVDTGIPQEILGTLLGGFETVETGWGLVALSAVVVVASNVLSNVPVILMLAESGGIISSPSAWLAVAWFSTIAGNLLLLGSAANLIVVRRLAEDGHGQVLTAFSHAVFGVPSTVALWAIGLLYFNYVLPLLRLWG